MSNITLTVTVTAGEALVLALALDVAQRTRDYMFSDADDDLMDNVASSFRAAVESRENKYKYTSQEAQALA
jgi:hypothetical protein